MCLLANSLKFEGSLILQLHGAGVLRLLVVECDAALNLRATAQWDGVVDEAAALADLAGAGGGSRLVLTLDPKDGGPLYQGVVALVGGSVAALFEHYLAKSEQIDSRLWLAAGAGRACGLLLQRMPGAADVDAATWRRAARAAAAAPAAFAAADAHALLAALFPDDDVRAFRARTPRFACSCSRQRVAGALQLLGSAEVESILARARQRGRRLRILRPALRVRRRGGTGAVRRAAGDRGALMSTIHPLVRSGFSTRSRP